MGGYAMWQGGWLIASRCYAVFFLGSTMAIALSAALFSVQQRWRPCDVATAREYA